MMRKVYIKMKILINGLFPLENYRFEELIFKTTHYDKSVIDVKNKDYIFYSSGHLLNSCYQDVEENIPRYNYFENEDYIELEINNEVYIDSESMKFYILEKMIKKVSSMEKRLRLITNLDIGLPILKADIYDEDKKYLTYVGFSLNQTSRYDISAYNADVKELLTSRLRLKIAESSINMLELENSRYKRAMTFYNESFSIDDIAVKFTLLFSSLESLFNLSCDDVTDSIAKYTSKIMFVSELKTKKYYYKIKDFYDKRSTYIHGNEPKEITKQNVFDLREIVREVLLLYWYISYWENIRDSDAIINFLEMNDKTTIHLSIQIFKKSLYMKDYQTFYQEIRSKLLTGETNLLTE